MVFVGSEFNKFFEFIIISICFFYPPLFPHYKKYPLNYIHHSRFDLPIALRITQTKGSHIHQQRFTDGETSARRQQEGNLADKPAVDLGKGSIQVCQVNDIFIGDGGRMLEVFYAKADRAVASVFDAHGQAVGAADDGAVIVHEAGGVLQQGARAEGIGIPGFALNTVAYLRRQLLQCQGQ